MKPRHAAALSLVGCLLSLSVLLFDGFAAAGGDWSPVRVETLTLLSDTDYVLVVSPVEQAYSSFPKACGHFEVHGTFSRLDHHISIRGGCSANPDRGSFMQARFQRLEVAFGDATAPAIQELHERAPAIVAGASHALVLTVLGELWRQDRGGQSQQRDRDDKEHELEGIHG